MSAHKGQSPKVSIGMPVWNGEEFIRHGLDSLLGQTFGDIEISISDNASTDATQAICEEYVRLDPRIRYSRTERNAGVHANFVKVLNLATGPYFMWACADDSWDPTYIEKMVSILDRRDTVVLAGSNAASIDERGARRRSFDNAKVYSPTALAARARRFISNPPGEGHATLIYGLMRTPIIQRIGLVTLGRIRERDRGYYADDLLTLFRLIFEGDFYVDDETMYFRRDVVQPRGSRSGGVPERPALERFRLTLRKLLNAHQYYADLRTILRMMDLDNSTRASLIGTTIAEEARFYPAFGLSTLERHRPRFRRGTRPARG
jgi:glycosyltransferase involved in cell wall biosynthesis